MNDKPCGFNPLRWDCGARGCYNVRHRPKIEVFAECFPGRIGMGDVDGIVEINGHFLLLEWKSVNKELPTGQRIMYERMTKNKQFSVVVVTGDPEIMTVDKYMIIYGGKIHPDVESDIDGVKMLVKRWSDWAGGVRAA